MTNTNRDPRILVAIAKHAPGADAITVEALAAAVENEMLGSLWERMHGVYGEQTEFARAVVEHVAGRVHSDVNAHQVPVKCPSNGRSR